VGDFITPRGTRVRVRARGFPLPRYLQREPTLIDAPGWRTCSGRRWPLGYVLYSGAAFAHHVLTDPLLAEYDFTIKVDTDIRFFRAPPENIVVLMQEHGCAIAHTSVLSGNGDGADCQKGAFAALLRFSELAASPIASRARPWCNRPLGLDYFYGNLMGGASSFLRSEANTLLNVWLYECDEGYFRNRWGDQASPALYICQWLDAPALADAEGLCDLSHWRRDGVFEHF
jgi:hypothetical protein